MQKYIIKCENRRFRGSRNQNFLSRPITMGGTSRKFPKVKKFPLKSTCTLTGLHICDFYKN